MLLTITNIVDAIYRVEGGTNTHHPYGILRHFTTTTPRQACFNTVQHAMHDYKVHNIDRTFIYFLADRYCPPSADKQGNLNWKINMVRILNLK